MEIFRLNDNQLKILFDWQKKHQRRYLGACGAAYTFSFTPTTLGTVIVVKNNSNGEEIDLTEYEDW